MSYFSLSLSLVFRTVIIDYNDNLNLCRKKNTVFYAENKVMIRKHQG